MDNGHRVLHQAFRFLPHERVGHQKATDEEEDINCQEGSCYEDEEKFLYYRGDPSYVLVILQPH